MGGRFLDKLVGELVEKFLENPQVVDYVNSEISMYAESMGFDALDEPRTEIQEELVCQYQLTVYQRILAGMMSRL